MISLIITTAFVLLTIFLVSRGIPLPAVFFFTGFLAALGITIATGSSVAAAGSGNLYLDIFEAVKETFVSVFGSTGLAMLPIYGYSVYMNKINAATVLGDLISRPIAKSKNPYFTGVFIAVLVCGIMRVAIVSAFAIMALFMTTLYPSLLKAGISRASAMAAIFLGTCFDWGPADFVVAQLFSGLGQAAPNVTVADYFVNGSIRVIPIVLVIVAATAGFIFQFIDRTSGYVLGSDAPKEETEAKHHGLPGYYCIFPLLPLIFILLFSPIILNLKTGVITAVMLSIIITFAVELLRKKEIRARVADFMSWVTGMGEGFASLLVMVIAAQFFANMLGKLNGFRFLVDTALGAGVSGYFLLILFGALMFLMCFLSGGGGVVGITLAPTVVDVAASLGIPFYAAIMPMQIANGLRGFNVGTAVHIQYAAKTADVMAVQILKRIAVPAVLMYVLTFFFAAVIL